MFVLGLDVKIIYVDPVKNVKATLEFEYKIILSEKTDFKLRELVVMDTSVGKKQQRNRQNEQKWSRKWYMLNLEPLKPGKTWGAWGGMRKSKPDGQVPFNT